MIENERLKTTKEIRNLRNIFLKILEREKINYFLNGRNTVDHNINITFTGIKNEFLFSKLNDISLSSGSACGSGSGEPSYVLKEIGLDKNKASSTLRIGIGKKKYRKRN